jgi:hypothetical protein
VKSSIPPVEKSITLVSCGNVVVWKNLRKSLPVGLSQWVDRVKEE